MNLAKLFQRRDHLQADGGGGLGGGCVYTLAAHQLWRESSAVYCRCALLQKGFYLLTSPRFTYFGDTQESRRSEKPNVLPAKVGELLKGKKSACASVVWADISHRHIGICACVCRSV